MSIVTKTGDQGLTSLYSGEQVKKNDVRVEAYGTIDELNAFLSEAKHYVSSDKIKTILIEIQKDLYKLAGSLATSGEYKYPIQEQDVKRISQIVHDFEQELSITGFVVLGTTLVSAKLDICRTIARKAERKIITLAEQYKIDKQILRYNNRLSDLLYIIARYEEKLANKLEYLQWQ